MQNNVLLGRQTVYDRKEDTFHKHQSGTKIDDEISTFFSLQYFF